MSAAHVLNGDQVGPMQLPMFMRAEDLRSSITATADFSHNDPDEVMENKLDASQAPKGYERGAGVYESVSREGVLNPVQMIHAEHNNLMQGQGHHRVAAAADIAHQTGRDMWVPVVHTDARASSDNPISIFSDPMEKREAIADYRNWSSHTAALGQDIMWRDEGVDS